MRLHRLFLIVLFFVLILISWVVVQAQSETCPALVEQALTEVGDNCGGLDRNSACYGFNRVDATFTEATAADFFSRPSDRAGLVTLKTIATVPLDVSLEHWGIAVMNVQANVPNSLPGQAVIFMLLGDVSVENAVAPEGALAEVEPIEVTTLVGSNLRSSGSLNANVVASVPEGTQLLADALNTNGRWLRVLAETGPAWISRDLVSAAADLGGLPVVDRETRTPMQAFYFSTGFGSPACNDAPPSLLLVQGPDQVRVDITANGADISIGSTIGLRVLEGGIMQLMVLSGDAQVGGVSMPAGFTIFVQLSEDGKSIEGAWFGSRALTEEELEALKGLENLPDALMHYGIVLPTIQQILSTQSQLGGSSDQPGTGGTDGVADGTVVNPAVTSVDCGVFGPTSPVGTIPYEKQTFYWNGAPGATAYQINFFDASGKFAFALRVPGDQSSAFVDVPGLGFGTDFTWEVVALAGDQTACTSGRVTINREIPAPPSGPPPDPEVPFYASWSCISGSMKVFINWEGAKADDVITVQFYDSMAGNLGGQYTGTSGSTSFYPVDIVSSGVVTTSSGGVAYLSPSTLYCY